MSKSEILKYIFKDKNRKSLPKILKEAIHFGFIENEPPHYYFENLLYKNGTSNYQDYIGHKKRGQIIDDFYFKNGEDEQLENKLVFADILQQHEVRTPKMLVYNSHLVLKTDKDQLQLNNANELAMELEKLIDASENHSIFIKRSTGLGGLVAFKFDKSNIHNHEKINQLYELMKKTDFIFQETIQQHEKINRIYSGSINTVRINSYRTGDNVKLLSALMRFGGYGSVVDNISSGGCFVPIDITDWTLEKTGYSFLKFGGKSFTEHPNTGFVFDDFKVPFEDDIVNEISKAALLFENDFIGWDVAITTDGPMIIEGNQNPHVIMTQITSGGFKKHSDYSEIFKDFI